MTRRAKVVAGESSRHARKERFTWNEGDIEILKPGDGEPLISEEELDRALRASGPAPEGSAQRMREHWDGGIIMEFDGVVEFDSEAERTGTPSLVGQRLPPPKKRRRKKGG
jgi:hypothetical protein